MKIKAFIFLSVIFFTLSQSPAFAQQKPCAYKGGTVDYLTSINCATDFNAMQSQPVKNNYAEVRSIKVIYDLSSKQIYYSNSKEHRFHFDFCSNVLHAYSTLEEFNRVEYSNSNQRRFAIANLNLYTASDLYTLEFFPDDEIRTSNVVEFFAKVKRTVYFGDRLRIADNNWHTAEWRKNNTLSFISPDELYAGQTFQSMKEGIA